MAVPMRQLCCAAVRQCWSRSLYLSAAAQAGSQWRTWFGSQWIGIWSFDGSPRLVICSSESDGNKEFNYDQCRQTPQGGARSRCCELHPACVYIMADIPSTLYSHYGRPAPPLKGQERRKGEREKFAVRVTPSCLSVHLSRRVVSLSSEVDRGMERWRERKEEEKAREEKKIRTATHNLTIHYDGSRASL
ncbi:hypothetical protein JZ751_017303 [Albula glossodonta]|uniref:Large ribosomal subunit protein mL52 n=1 Tax=Albula glossodonta TaxID=121402 RepID=A0A8T2MK12_9TELE|nr:hypothetical protein JZ751_017303 [Albula glossodonta]